MRIVMPAQAGAVHNIRWSSGLASRGHQVVLLSNSRFPSPSSDVETIILPGSSPAAYIFNIPRMRKIIRRIQPDIVHAHYATGYGLWGSCQHIAPLVLTVWGTDIEDALAGKLIIAPLVRRALKSARFVTAASRFLIERTLAFEPSVEDKTRVIPFGVPIPDDGEADTGDHDNAPVRFIYTKNFRPAYAPDITLKAFLAAGRDNPAIHLTMIGGGPMRADLERMVEDDGCGDRVTILGWQNMAETEKLIRESDVMLMPSRRESFGVAALEALSHGKPVIASAVGGIPEIVQDGVNGILTPADDVEAVKSAILRLAADGPLRLQMGRAGRQMVKERFDFERCLDMMEKLYAQAAG